MKLRNNNPLLKGKKVNIPKIGEVKLDENGFVEIEDKEIAELLVEKTPHWEYEGKPKAKEVDKKIENLVKEATKECECSDEKETIKKLQQSNLELKQELVELQNQVANLQSEPEKEKGKKTEKEVEETETITYNADDLKKLALKDLIEIAENADLDKKEWSKFKNNKTLMINYLTKK